MKLRNLFSRKPRVEVVAVVLRPELGAALKAMAEVFGDGMTASMTGGSFTCTEADAIARVLLLSGHEDEALEWLTGHASGDDLDDAHFYTTDEDDEDECRPLTEQELTEYVGWLAA